MAEERRMAEDRRNERRDGQCATEGGAGACGAETPPRSGSGLTPEVVVPDRELGAYRRKMRLIEFTHSSTRATVLMVAAALVALFIENVPFLPALADFWHDAHVGFTVGGFTAQMSVGHFVNDFLMACFFLLVGLEIKREMVAGELVEPRKALLPVVAAFGGATVPALIYLGITAGSGYTSGWGVPMASDIAFCLGILALLGKGVPAGLRVFLSTLAIADDMIAIVVIAVFYTSDLQVGWLLGAFALFAVALVLNRLHLYDLTLYLVVGVAMWVCFLFSGVHATLAGVLLAFAIPVRAQADLDRVGPWLAEKARQAEGSYDPGEPDIAQKEQLHEMAHIRRVSRMSIPPAVRLETYLHTPVYFFILPLFAFSNAAVAVAGTDVLATVAHPVSLGVFCGLVLGKPIGIFLTTFAVVKLRLSELPSGVRWGHVAGAAVLGGVGFTMAIFVANLSFADAATVGMAKVAILAASLVAGVAGFLVLRRQAARDARSGAGSV